MKMKLPTWKQAFLILGGALVLNFCACFGFLVSAEYADQNSFAAVVTVALGIVALITLLIVIPYSLVVMCIRMIRALMAPSPPPPTPPPAEDPDGS
jgi:hypothetical protein